MAKSDNRDSMMARRMATPGGPNYKPAPRFWRGVGFETMKAARRTGIAWKAETLARQDFGLLGGVLAARAGLGTFGVPAELLERADK